jgi:hypothetical protein
VTYLWHHSRSIVHFGAYSPASAVVVWNWPVVLTPSVVLPWTAAVRRKWQQCSFALVVAMVSLVDPINKQWQSSVKQKIGMVAHATQRKGAIATCWMADSQIHLLRLKDWMG